ncbi:MAG: glycoside hydrolase family 88 protein [candidate division KSB1 bacterium]|nr:glycoside hydrolase family 88 protein [candidate division KSB1 bacterium]
MIKLYRVIWVGILLLPGLAYSGENTAVSDKQQPLKMIDRLAQHFWQSHNHFADEKDVWGPYHLDLTFEALLTVDAVLNSPRYLPRIQEVMRKRHYEPSDTVSFSVQPFCNITFALFKAEQDSDYIAPFVSETKRMLREVKRSREGAVCHIHDEPGCQLLIDYLQEYSSRTARAGHLTGERELYKECVDQYKLYARILRDPDTGLWRQGRGWLQNPATLSPGAWSRGHGWLIRGMVTSLDVLPPQSPEFRDMRKLLQKLADSLLKVQNDNGMWHQLLNRPFSQSYPESSGTGLIAYYLAHAWDKEYIKDVKYKKAARKAIQALYHYMTPQGAVLGTCPGPGPLRSETPCLKQKAPVNDPHGAPALIYAFAGELLLQD